MITKRPFRSVSSASLLLLLVASPILISGTKSKVPGNNAVDSAAISFSAGFKSAKDLIVNEAYALYDSMKLKRFGLSKKAFEFAWKGYKSLVESGKVNKTEVLSICDFSQSSRRKRLYIINVEQKKVLVNTYVAHGKKSGGEFANSFSNSPESHKSSLGFYITKRTYFGGHGLSLMIDGVEKGINDKANARNIVVHGSDYVGRGNGINGRSYGCPAVPEKETNKIINTIKGGSCLFIYHPTKNYLSQSKILND